MPTQIRNAAAAGLLLPDLIRNQGELFLTPKYLAPADSPYSAARYPHIYCNAATGPITINLPSLAANPGKVYVIQKYDASSNAVTIVPNGADQVQFAASFPLYRQYDVVVLAALTVTTWLRVAEYQRPSRARATVGTTHNAASGAFTVVAYDTEDYDELSEYNTGTYTFTAKSPGVYNVTASVLIADAAGDLTAAEYATLAIYRDSTQFSRLDRYQEIAAPAGTAKNLFLGGSDNVPLTAGQTINIRVYHNVGAALSIIDNVNGYSHLAIHRLQ